MSLKNFETYELFMLISPDIPSQGVKSIFKKILDYSCKAGGSVKKFEYVGQRKLAYKIGKYSHSEQQQGYGDNNRNPEPKLYFKREQNGEEFSPTFGVYEYINPDDKENLDIDKINVTSPGGNPKKTRRRKNKKRRSSKQRISKK